MRSPDERPRLLDQGSWTMTKQDADGFLDPKNRRDHIVPQVYLRGFIHPRRDQKRGPLEVFRLASNTWGLPQTPDELCTEVGFYDYSVEKAETTADDAFRELEEGLFTVRDRLRRDNFQAWTKEREFLIKFALMLAVRSRMFREGLIASASRETAFRILGIDGRKFHVEPFELGAEPEAPKLLKNRSITDMRTAIERDAKEWNGWRWGLRLAPSVDCPFVTSDHPPVMRGEDPDRDLAYRAQNFSIVVPFGWDFALVGGPAFSQTEGPVYLPPDEMDDLRIVSTSGARETLISPIILLDMTWFGRVKPCQ